MWPRKHSAATFSPSSVAKWISNCFVRARDDVALRMIFLVEEDGERACCLGQRHERRGRFFESYLAILPQHPLVASLLVSLSECARVARVNHPKVSAA